MQLRADLRLFSSVWSFSSGLVLSSLDSQISHLSCFRLSYIHGLCCIFCALCFGSVTIPRPRLFQDPNGATPTDGLLHCQSARPLLGKHSFNTHPFADLLSVTILGAESGCIDIASGNFEYIVIGSILQLFLRDRSYKIDLFVKKNPKVQAYRNHSFHIRSAVDHSDVRLLLGPTGF